MKKLVWYLIPVLIMFDILFINKIFDFVRQKSDIQVMISVLLFCIFIFANVTLIKFFIKLFNHK